MVSAQLLLFVPEVLFAFADILLQLFYAFGLVCDLVFVVNDGFLFLLQQIRRLLQSL